MITLAFAQMIYYVGVSLNRYGADDGLTIYRRSQFAGLHQSLQQDGVLLRLLSCSCWRRSVSSGGIVNSRFGMVIQGARSNERRMRAIGFPTFRYRLACFVIAGVMCGLVRRAARQSHRVHQSGDDALDALGRSHRHGGAGRHGLAVRAGDRRRGVPAAGGGASSITASSAMSSPGWMSRPTKEYWQIIFGPMLLCVVLFARGGIDGLLAELRRG